MTDSSSQKKYGLGASGKTALSFSRMPDSRPMSWAFGGTGPSGGRRRTPSQFPTLKRYVRLEAPEANWLTSSSPSGTSPTCARRYRSAASRSKSSPSRTFIVSLMSSLPGSDPTRRLRRYLHARWRVGAFHRRPQGQARSPPFQRLAHVLFVAFSEVESQQGAVVQAKAVQIHTREDRRRAEEVLDVEAASCARADEIDGVRPRGIEVVCYGPSVTEGSEEDFVSRGRVGDGAGAVGGHEDHVFAPDYLGRVLFREGTVIVAFYPRGVLLASAQARAGVQPPSDLICLLQARRGVDGPCAVLQDGQQGRRRHEDVDDDGGGASKPLGHNLLSRHQHPEPLQEIANPSLVQARTILQKHVVGNPGRQIWLALW